MPKRCSTCGIYPDRGVCHCPETAFAAIESLTAENATLKADLAAAREDSARLDWLEKMPPLHTVIDYLWPPYARLVDNSHFGTVREVIDEARATEEPENKGPLSPEDLFGEHAHDGGVEEHRENLREEPEE